MRIDPAIVAPSPVAGAEADIAPPAGTSERVTGDDVPNASDQIALAFGS
jgi:hypothetical protein